jgi:hypothetical protein
VKKILNASAGEINDYKTSDGRALEDCHIPDSNIKMNSKEAIGVDVD